MMKSNKKQMIKIIGLSLLAVFTLQACSMPTATPAQSLSDAVDQQVDSIVETTQAVVSETTEESQVEEAAPLVDANVETLENGLTQAEVDSLVFMREEEKLARDVYLALYDIWGLPVFQNIADSEQTHTDSVADLLVGFNIPDPADTSPPGEFVNQDLQDLYNDLVEWGSESLADALKVGAAIEEIDILDLEEALGYVQDPSIQRVYENLLKGSENHLRAFTSTLENQTGEIYEPQYMSSESYADAISGETSKGGRGNGRQP